MHDTLLGKETMTPKHETMNSFSIALIGAGSVFVGALLGIGLQSPLRIIPPAFIIPSPPAR
jgi:hypothetical protein